MGFLIFNNTTSDIIAIFIIILTCIYFYIKHLYSYWNRCGVKFKKPIFPFGNLKESFLQKKNFAVVIQDLYHEMKNHSYFGMFMGFRPILIIRDPEIIRSAFIKDFQHFHDRGVYIDEKNDPLSGHLFALSGEKWKNLRVQISPVFTSGKLKAMFQTLIDCGEPLIKYMNNIVKNNEIIEIRELSARYTTNIIASVAFGIDINCIDEPDTAFRKYGRKAFEPNLKNAIRGIIASSFISLQKIIKIKLIDDDVEDFIMSMVKQTLDYREQNKIVRKDFFQLLIQLRNTGKVQIDGNWDIGTEKDDKYKTLTFNELAAQAWVFYLAGFETSSTVMSFCLFELAKNPDIQKKVQLEIDEILQKHDNKITYDAIHDMKYLECCIDETMRLYPPVPVLHRECTKPYTFEKTNFTLAKGIQTLIPVLAIHRDPKYYPEPLKFIPERFNSENLSGKSFTDMPYMPFGDGPRICIGMRMGKMQTKVGLTLMLQNYNYQLDEQKTNRDVTIHPAGFIIQPMSGFHLKVTNRSTY